MVRLQLTSKSTEASGLIKVKQGTTLDYETKESYAGQVKWTVVQGQEAVANLTILVANMETGKPAAPTVRPRSVQRANQPGLGRELDRPLLGPKRVWREGPCHLVRGAVSGEGEVG